MGVKKKAAEHGDRVRRDDGLMGTIISLHTKGPAYGVLPDVGVLQMWPKVECTVLDDIPRACPRCGIEGHRAQSCQAEYLAWKARKREELALAAQDFAQPAWDVNF